ncbi:MAG: BTAD domain-containing putative transcriptional regulator [Gaiellaceae bacterium]
MPAAASSSVVRPPPGVGLARARLLDRFADLWGRRLALVVAPAGAGKTTLLAHIAEGVACPVAWYRAETRDRDLSTFTMRLSAAFASALPGLPCGPLTLENLVAALEALGDASDRRLLLVVDDFYVLQGTAGEEKLGLLIDYAPPALAIAVASRSRPDLNVSRRRVSGTVIEIGPDDLRFRSWEVERLFHDVFGEPLPPEDLAALTRRTEGWAAGLRLFHLATAGKPTPERRRTLAMLGARWKPTHEYLTNNVLADLPDAIRGFLVDSCILPRLNGTLCDELLGREDSARMLEELERRQIFVDSLDEAGSYRYHEVLRSFLEANFVDRFGEAWARDRYQRAGELLEATGYAADALPAYARAGDWAGLARLLGDNGERAVRRPSGWLELLPDWLVSNDPWLLLATARDRVAAGRFAEAVEPYGEAERCFGTEAGSEVARRERAALVAWLEPAFAPPREWAGLVRKATMREPLAAARAAISCARPQRAFVAGLAALLAGQLTEAQQRLREVRAGSDASAQLAAAARVGCAVTLLLAGDVNANGEAEGATDEADALGMRWLARLGRASFALGDRPDGRVEAAAARAVAAREGDAWGEAYAAFAEGWGALRAGEDPTAPLEIAMSGFRRLGAGVLEAWASAAHALARVRAGDHGARQLAVDAESAARALGVPGAHACAYLALAETREGRRSEFGALADALGTELGIALPGATHDAGGPPSGERPGVTIRCFGDFRLSVGESPVDLRRAKPRARQILRFLAMLAPQPVHREVLAETFWPGADAGTSGRNLHVALSSLRKVLEAELPGIGPWIVRDGDAYQLELKPGDSVDVIEFDSAIASGRDAQAHGDSETAISSFERALDLYAGELLSEDGPSEWLVRERERRRFEACAAAHAAGRLLLAHRDPARAAAACERGLYANPYDDALWRLCIDAHEAAGDPAAAARTRRRYEDLLEALGLGAGASRSRAPRARSS